MKSLKIYIVALCLVTLSSCKDYLDTAPATVGTEENFYKTPDQAFSALVGCYDGLQKVWGSGIALPLAAEIMSDDCFGGTGNSDGFGYQMLDEFDKTRSAVDQNLFESNWIDYYKAIYRCNMLLSKMDQIEWGTKTDLRPVYEAEARFLRAYLYFDMVKLWGNIPLITVPTSENVNQANPDEVYKVIAEDLKFATENLSNSAIVANAATQGRVTKWAAEALLARVFLFYTGYYGKADLVGLVTKAQALADVEDLIANSGHGLVEKFENLWPAASGTDYAGEANKEVVFSIKYTYTSNYNGNTDGNHWMIMYGIREQSLFPYGNGWGGATVNPKLWNAFSEKDSRRNASIISIKDEDLKFENQGKQREYTGYYNKKYAPLSDEDGNSVPVEKYKAVNFMIGQYQDYFSIRYSDVLLMAAELGSANSQKYFDDVRKRAYGANFTNLAVTQDNIMKERWLEFALEGIRYWDLLRSGVNAAASTIAETSEVLNGGTKAVKTISSSKVVETKGLQQIPNNQITLSNGVLKQNAGW
jgi:starch-binding outer membrane protein, SusD/RagB family